MLLLDALKDDAYAADDNANANAKNPNVSCHLAGAFFCLLMLLCCRCSYR
jgi:hypothetical protein